MSEPLLTVALPLWNARPILWLAVEALKRQTGGIPYELIVVEEDEFVDGQEGYVGPDYDWPVPVNYVSLNTRWPLSWKWRLMGKMASPSSRGFMLTAADNYSPATRMEKTLAALERRDWVHAGKGAFLNLRDWRAATFHARWARHPCGLWMGVRTNLVREMDDRSVWSGVDRWFYQNVRRALKPTRPRVGTFTFKDGLHTDGANQISLTRGKLISEAHSPFRPMDRDVASTVPTSVLQRLQAQFPVER